MTIFISNLDFGINVCLELSNVKILICSNLLDLEGFHCCCMKKFARLGSPVGSRVYSDLPTTEKENLIFRLMLSI